MDLFLVDISVLLLDKRHDRFQSHVSFASHDGSESSGKHDKVVIST